MNGALSYSARRGRIHLRLVAYHPSLEPIPEDHLKVVVQAVEKGRPIAEDPIAEGVLPRMELARYLHESRNDGWDLQPWEDHHGH